jgi:hypothetical protein
MDAMKAKRKPILLNPIVELGFNAFDTRRLFIVTICVAHELFQFVVDKIRNVFDIRKYLATFFFKIPIETFFFVLHSNKQ